MKYDIPTGGTFCNQSQLWHLLGDVKEIDFDMEFNESVLWDQGSTSLNNAAQKDFGVSFGIDNHWNSWRMTHSIGSITNKVLILRDYRYIRGIRVNTPFILPVNKLRFLNERAKAAGNVKFNRPQNRIDLSIPQLQILHQGPFDFSGVSLKCYQQYFYMEPKVPWPMSLIVNQIYTH